MLDSNSFLLLRIFEDSGEDDCLLVGRLPKSKTGPARQPSDFRSLPLSPHYARVLAELAHQQGFDGYLLNFECPLRGGIEQTRAVAAWITVLVDEMKSKIEPMQRLCGTESRLRFGRAADP
jgi:mannosyl-glycoprotein endo-beta-N-acetylglucosaminidase